MEGTQSYTNTGFGFSDTQKMSSAVGFDEGMCRGCLKVSFENVDYAHLYWLDRRGITPQPRGQGPVAPLTARNGSQSLSSSRI